jgi:hypothetical protein
MLCQNGLSLVPFSSVQLTCARDSFLSDYANAYSYFLPPLGSYQELGGNSEWIDRFLARFSAVFYYFIAVGMYMLSPRMACEYRY